MFHEGISDFLIRIFRPTYKRMIKLFPKAYCFSVLVFTLSSCFSSQRFADCEKVMASVSSYGDSLAINAYISLTTEYLNEHNESWPIDSCDVYSIYETFKYKKTMLPLGDGRVFADDDFRVVRISSPKIGGYKILDNLEKNCPVIMKIIFDDSLSKGVIVVKDVFIYTRYIEKQEDGTWRLKKIRSGF